MRKQDQEVLDRTIREYGWHHVAQAAVEHLRAAEPRLDYVSPDAIRRRVLHVILRGIDSVWPPEPAKAD